MATKVEKKSRIYSCGHCNEEVSRTTFYAHKRLYYNRSTKEWSRVRVNFAEESAPSTPGRQGLVGDCTMTDEEGNFNDGMKG